MTLPLDEAVPPLNDVPAPKVSRQGQGGGPKTSFGKEASSKNSTTHGLSARKFYTLPDHFQRDVHDRMTWYVAHHQPQCDNDSALCGLAAITFVQHRESISEKYQYLRIRSRRAQTSWGIDRSVDAGLLAAKLPKRPDVVAAQLAGTYYGALWLLERWRHLATSLELVGTWMEEEISLAHDMLGRDAMTRRHDPDRVAGGSLDERKALVARQIDRLQSLVDGPLQEEDAELRKLAILGELYLDDPIYRRIDRHGQRALNLNRRCIDELERRRVARGLNAYNPDGTIATPPPKPGDPTIEADPDYVPAFYDINDEPPAPEPAPEPEPQTPATPPQTIRNPPRPEAARPTMTVANEPAERRPKRTPEQLREARQKQAEALKAEKREKARVRAERKAAKAARKRNR